jgi:hypothetical protein
MFCQRFRQHRSLLCESSIRKVPPLVSAYADAFKPRILAILLRRLAEAFFFCGIPVKHPVANPRTVEYRMFALRAEETQNQLTACDWKGLSSIARSPSLANWLGLSDGDGAKGDKGQRRNLTKRVRGPKERGKQERKGIFRLRRYGRYRGS